MFSARPICSLWPFLTVCQTAESNKRPMCTIPPLTAPNVDHSRKQTHPCRMTFGGRRFLFCAGGFFRFFPLSPLLVKQQKITQVRTMRTTRPTRPATRYVPTPPESDIFGGPCPLTACPSLPAPPWLHVGVVGAHPGRSSSPPHPALWRVQLTGREQRRHKSHRQPAEHSSLH